MIISSSWNNNNAASEKSSALTQLKEFAAEITTSSNMRAFKFEPKPSATPAVNAVLGMVVFAYVPVDTTLTVNVLGTSITLTAKEAPTAGEFLTTTSAPTNLSDYLELVAESIADALNQTAFINTNYTVTLNGNNIALEAIQAGEKFNISASVSTNVIFTTNVNGSEAFDSQALIDYFGFVDVYVGNQVFAESVNKYEAILIDSYPVDTESNTVEIGIDSPRNWVNKVLPIRQPSGANEFYQMDKGTSAAGVVIPSEDAQTEAVNLILRPYFLVYGDSYRFVENGQRKRFVRGVSPIRWVQLGALDKLHPYDMGGHVFNPVALASFDWLTSRPNGRFVTMDSHEYAQCIVRHTSTAATLSQEIKYIFHDGTSETTTKSALPLAGIGGNISFDISPNALNVKTIEITHSKLVASYEFRLKWNNAQPATGQSAKIVRHIDRTCYDQETQILFLNEFGAWDSLTFRGKKSTKMSREVRTIKRALPFSANRSGTGSSEVKTAIGITSNKVFTLDSGILSNEQYLWASRLLDSSAVYIWNESLQAYESIIIQSHNYELDSTKHGQNIRVTFERTVLNNTITQ